MNVLPAFVTVALAAIAWAISVTISSVTNSIRCNPEGAKSALPIVLLGLALMESVALLTFVVFVMSSGAT